MKKILVLGGTQFIGRVLAENLLLSGNFEVTLFNRGKTNAGLFPDAKKIHGNRETADLYQTCNEYWDAVIDISGYFPNTVQAYAQRVKDNCRRYIFISTASVYNLENSANRLIPEDFELLTCTAQQRTDATMATYGQRKAACEEALLQCPGLDAIILRPSVVYGPYDPFDRHYYWLYRTKKRSRILFPEGNADIDSFTFVQDLARIIIAAIDLPQHRKVYNVNTHPLMSLQAIVEAMTQACNTAPQLTFAGVPFLDEQEVQVWSDLPLWMNGSFLMMDNSRLLSDFGLQMTPITESFIQTAAWYEQLGWPLPKTGLSLEEEDELLEALNA
ncbi:hypothetical protein C7N43_15460 [Sphingobacteriales bacterium UPWRP_1]|nr:hypothetical protein BVG80_07635 [Sphingobacteriales bacterium TSM_CSM]PSJ76118.1 hypothetical protein C7N43_15460 [Sphingobacteriales bacterium UPWRP_1]